MIPVLLLFLIAGAHSSCSGDEVGLEHKSNLRTNQEEGSGGSADASPDNTGTDGQTTILQGDSENGSQAGTTPGENNPPPSVDGPAQQAEGVSPWPEGQNASGQEQEQELPPQAGSPVDLVSLNWTSPGADADIVYYQVFAKEDLPYLAETGFLAGDILVSDNSFDLAAPAITLNLAEVPELMQLKGKKVCFQVVAHNNFGRSLASDQICLDSL